MCAAKGFCVQWLAHIHIHNYEITHRLQNMFEGFIFNIRQLTCGKNILLTDYGRWTTDLYSHQDQSSFADAQQRRPYSWSGGQGVVAAGPTQTEDPPRPSRRARFPGLQEEAQWEAGHHGHRVWSPFRLA